MASALKVDVIQNSTGGAFDWTSSGVRELTSGTAVASTSGTSIDFTGIPSWVKRITVMFHGVSTDGSSALMVQIGGANGVENTNYFGVAAYVAPSSSSNALNFTTGFGLDVAGASTAIRHGSCVLTLLSANLWAQSSNVSWSNIVRTTFSAGTKTTSGALDRVRITTVNGTDAFDAGSINIMYE